MGLLKFDIIIKGDTMQISYKDKYFDLLKKIYKTKEEVGTEIINLKDILALPKGTEHFMSDLHGEYEAFRHILNNCSGVIREKVDIIFPYMSEEDKKNFCTLIYYPEEKLSLLDNEGILTKEWYLDTLKKLIILTSYISSKYTRAKVKKAIKPQFSYIIDELIHTKDNQETNIQDYFSNILNAIIDIDCPNSFIKEFARLIKTLAVDHLHVAGDIYDRGPRPDKIVDLLMEHHSIDIEWGNHDILWFGAAAGIPVCVFTVLYNNLKYDNIQVLENSYGISLRKLINYANALYIDSNNNINPVIKTILLLLLKLEGKVIKENPSFGLNERLVLDKINYEKGLYIVDGNSYELKDKNLKNINPNNPYEISSVEQEIIDDLCYDFTHSVRLHTHLKFLLDKGSVYKCYNGNLIYHGCIPLDQNGNFKEVDVLGEKLSGKKLLDKIDLLIRHVMLKKATKQERDYMYYLWGGFDSPFTGRIYKTFELQFITEKKLQSEPRNPYYEYRNSEEKCLSILKEFDLPSTGHIINGHLPVKAKNGENPIMANGRLIIIDGGFCKAYHAKTGIAGYTLIANSHGLRIKAHSDFSSIEEVLKNNSDIISASTIIETSKNRIHVRDTYKGLEINENVSILTKLLEEYRKEEKK